MKNTILIKSYDKSAGIYDQKFKNMQYVKFGTMLEKEKIFSWKRLLDLGCGTGLLSEYLKSETENSPKDSMLPEYHGIDFSCRMVKRAQEKGIGNIVTGSIGALPWPDGFFDAVLSFTVIGLSDDPLKRIFRETGRVLVPGGKFIITVLEKHHTEALENSLAQSGFDIVELKSGCGQDFGIKAVKNC